MYTSVNCRLKEGAKIIFKVSLRRKIRTKAYLCECHPGDDGEHYLLSFGGVGVLLVLLQPSLQGAGGLPGGIFATGSTIGTGVADDDDNQVAFCYTSSMSVPEMYEPK